ncbi:tetratricopeptide repeat protein [Saccharothrix deserti]|uniref:tetratricopeptide repeat protein n=1 Tax=Saccharothrix deserti TaxID=2593674 RepID=UPI001EE40650|nr:tetratricopeptide repeat protein [Saccharothrix deserti]
MHEPERPSESGLPDGARWTRVENDVSGTATGPVVQLGALYGDLHVHSTAPSAAQAVTGAVEGRRFVRRIPARAGCFQDRASIGLPIEETLGVLTGLGGVGKTQLAAEYARRGIASGDVDLVVWVAASSRDAIVSRYAEAGVEFAGADPGDPELAAELFLGWLETTPRRWLIVLDDLTSPADLTGLRPPAEVPSGRTVITTRRRDAAVAGLGGRRVEIGVFTEAEAHAYLHAALDERLADDVTGVVADLGRLPLALGQAAAYMLDQDVSCADYRRRFADRTKRLADLVPASDALPDQYHKTVAVTWSLSIEAADAERPTGLAGPVLELAGVLDPGGIPTAVFTTQAARTWLGHARTVDTDAEWEELDADTAHAALRRLHLFSLATIDSGTVRVHAVVQRAVRDHLPPGRLGDLAWVAADALVDLWPDGGREPDLGQTLRANADAIDRCAGEHLWTPDEFHPVLAVAGNSLGFIGQVSAAATYFARLHATAAERLGPDHRFTLGALGSLATWQGESGNPESVPIARRLVADRQRVLGPRHPDTLTARHTLARQLDLVGDPADAAAELDQLLADRVAVLGADHPDTLTTRHNLAANRGEAGDATGAVEVFEALLVDTERVLGADHPDTLSTRHELARWRSAAGDPTGAAAAFAQLFADRVRVLGPDHPLTLTTRSELALTTGLAGDPAGATAALESLLADRLRVLGPDHPDTLETRLSLIVSGAEDGPPDGIAEVEVLLGDMLRVLGPYHPSAWHTCAYLAVLRGGPGDPMVTAADELLAACLRVLGTDHPDIWRIRTQVVLSRSEAGDAVGAAEAYEGLVSDVARQFGPDHQNTLRARRELARRHALAGDAAAAVAVAQQLLDDRLRLLGTDHPDTLASHADLATYRSLTAAPEAST